MVDNTDTVELARRSVERHRSLGGDPRVFAVEYTLAQAVLDKQKRIERLEAVNEHIEEVNNKRYGQLLIAEGKLKSAEAKLAEVRAVLCEADRVVTWESTALSRSFQDVVDAAISGDPIPTYAHAAIQPATKEGE